MTLSTRARALIVQEALTWERTPYHDHGRLKGIGTDCAMLPAEVYAACGLIPPIPPQDYPVDWHMHRDGERFLAHVLEHADETLDPQPGDLVLYRWGRVFAHSGIVIAWPRIIHAVIGEGVVQADGDAGVLTKRERRFFTVRGGDTDGLEA